MSVSHDRMIIMAAPQAPNLWLHLSDLQVLDVLGLMC